MLTLCLVGEFPPPPGGMAQQAELLFRNFSREGAPVARVRSNAEFWPAVRFLGRVRGLRAALRFALFNLSLVRRLGKDRVFHIVANSYLSFFLYAVPPLVYGNLFGKTTVLNYHGGSADEFLSRLPFARRFFHWADRVVVPSGYLKSVFEKHGVTAEVVPNACDFDRFSFRARERPRPVIVVARHLEPIYNVECALKAFAAVRAKYADARMLVAGDGGERRRLRETAQRLGVDSSVEFLGNVPNEEMPAVYGRADIFLNASNVDNMPQAILEAFASGLPVVSTRAGGIPFMVEHERTGLLTATNDHEDLARQIARLLDHPDLARTVANNARETLPQYRWERVRSRWLEIYGG